MSSRREFLLSSGSVLAALALPARGAAALPVSLTALAPNIWRHLSGWVGPDGTSWPSNGLVVKGKRRVLIIDTTWVTADMESLLGEVKRIAGDLPQLLVPTHAHGDRMSGLAIAREHGVETMAFRLSQEDAPSRDLPIAERTWSGKTKRFDLGGSHVEFFHPGHAHTRDNIVGFVEEGGVLFGGCMLRSMTDDSVGSLSDASLAVWPASLDRVVRRYGDRTRIAVPGHFDYGGPELLAHTRALLNAAIVRRAKG